jgi:hypothetical protein
VDRNLNDLLLIYEEFSNKYLGYSTSSNKSSGSASGGGVSAGSDKDTCNFIKARLTSGKTKTFTWFYDEEHGKRDMRIAESYCQGNILAATNNDLSDADMNILSRLIVLSVPKSKNEKFGLRPADKKTHQSSDNENQNSAAYEEHKEIHRVYFLLEFLIKSRVFRDHHYGGSVDGGRIQITAVLDRLHHQYGIPTGDIRKRDHVLEMAWVQTKWFAVCMGLKSPKTRHLQYNPYYPESDFIGFNPRVIMYGILPFLVITADQVIDGCTLTSSLFLPDHQDLILEVFATQKCRLQDLRESDFMLRKVMNQNLLSASGRGNSVPVQDENSRSLLPDLAGGGVGHVQPLVEKDYNYIVMRGKKHVEIFTLLSQSLGELMVAPNDISKLLKDLEKSMPETDGYEMREEPVPGSHTNQKRRRLVRSGDISQRMPRKVVDVGYCPTTGRATIAILVAFLKQKLSALLPDAVIENLLRVDQGVSLEAGAGTAVARGDAEIQRLLHFINTDEDLTPQRQQQQRREAEREPDEAVPQSANEMLYMRMQDLGKVNHKSDSLVVKAIRDILEHRNYGQTPRMDPEEQKALEEQHKNQMSGAVPWNTFILADPPKPLVAVDTREQILFVDKLQVMELKQRPEAQPFIIQNYNTACPSARSTLSSYLGESRGAADNNKRMLVKNRATKYLETEAWVVDQDIDSIFCDAHWRAIGQRQLQTLPPDDYNYPPTLYRALVDHGKPLVEYPLHDIAHQLKLHEKQRLIKANPAAAKCKKFSSYMNANYAKNPERAKRPAPTKKRAALSTADQVKEKQRVETEKKRRCEMIQECTQVMKRTRTI